MDLDRLSINAIRMLSSEAVQQANDRASWWWERYVGLDEGMNR
jgi:hypothetical protein